MIKYIAYFVIFVLAALDTVLLMSNLITDLWSVVAIFAVAYCVGGAVSGGVFIYLEPSAPRSTRSRMTWVHPQRR